MNPMPNAAGWDNLSLFDEPNQEDLDMPMSEIERSELAGYEQVIEQGLQVFYEVGTALLAIRDKRLYRSEFRLFEEYCRVRWNISRDSADNYIKATKAFDNIKAGEPDDEDHRRFYPGNLEQTLPLSKLKEAGEQREAWQRAVDTAPDGNITGAHVKRIVNEMLGKTPPPIPAPITDDTDDPDDETAWEQRIYQGGRAYCKYCYNTHDAWEQSYEHDGIVWECKVCHHFMKDEFMEIEEPAEPRKTVSELRKEYIAAARREGIKPDINPAQSTLLNEARLFEYLPAAKEFITDINRMIIQMQKEFPVAVDIGKLSPEAEQYVANRLDILIDILSKRRDELRNTDND